MEFYTKERLAMLVAIVIFTLPGFIYVSIKKRKVQHILDLSPFAVVLWFIFIVHFFFHLFIVMYSLIYKFL